MPRVFLTTRMLSALVALAFVLVVGAAGAALLTASRGQEAELVDRAEDLVGALDLARIHERKLASARGYLLSGDRASLSGFHEADRQLHVALGVLQAEVDSEPGVELLAAIVDVERRHDTVMTELLAERVDGAPRWHTEARPLAFSTRDTIDALIVHKRARYEVAGVAATHAERRAITLLICLTVAALALGIAGVVLLRRSGRSALRSEREARLLAESSQAFLSSLLDQLPVGVIVAAAPSGELRHVNETARRTIGEAGVDRDRLERAIRGEVVGERITLADGRVLEASAGPVRNPDGRVDAAVLAFADVTERQRGEQEREQFLHVLSHDLRNPLGAISLSATHLASADLPEPSRRIAVRIVAAASRLERLIAQLLDFARGRAGALRLEPRRVELPDLLADVIAEVELGSPDCKVRLVVDGDGDGGGQWDRDRLAQVFQNLIGNAVEHRAPDSEVEVRVAGDRAEARVSVTNRGDPIPGDLVPRVFEPFARGGRGKGLGLGLYIVRQIVVAHGGEVSVASEGDHTTFSVRLPRQPARLEAAA